jgi:hypothetical protein
MKSLSKLALAGILLTSLALPVRATEATSATPTAAKTPADLSSLFQPAPQPRTQYCVHTCPNGTIQSCPISACTAYPTGMVCMHDFYPCPQ